MSGLCSASISPKYGSGLPPWEASSMIAEKRKLFFSFILVFFLLFSFLYFSFVSFLFFSFLSFSPRYDIIQCSQDLLTCCCAVRHWSSESDCRVPKLWLQLCRSTRHTLVMSPCISWSRETLTDAQAKFSHACVHLVRLYMRCRGKGSSQRGTIILGNCLRRLLADQPTLCRSHVLPWLWSSHWSR